MTPTRYPFLLLLVRAIGFTVLPVYALGQVFCNLDDARMTVWAVLFWIVLSGLFLWHGLACCREVRRRWTEEVSQRNSPERSCMKINRTALLLLTLALLLLAQLSMVVILFSASEKQAASWLYWWCLHPYVFMMLIAGVAHYRWATAVLTLLAAIGMTAFGLYCTYQAISVNRDPQSGLTLVVLPYFQHGLLVLVCCLNLLAVFVQWLLAPVWWHCSVGTPSEQ